MKHLLVLTTAVLTFALAPPAFAGAYDVQACHIGAAYPLSGNNSWVPDLPSPYLANLVECPGSGITSKLHLGSDRVPYGTSTRFTFTAPAGTAISRFRGHVQVNAARGWYAGFVDASPQWIYCGAGCSTLGTYQYVDLAMETPRLFAHMTCGDFAGCPRFAQDGFLAMRNVTVTIVDYVPPEIAITGGSVSAPGWHTGDQTVAFAATDSAGVRYAEVLVNDSQQGARRPTCDVSRPRPCDDVSAELDLRASAFGYDGAHTLVIRAIDTGGNPSETTRRVLVDLTAPTQPLAPDIVGGESWRATNGFTVRWTNPQQPAAPIAAVRYSLCPTSTPLTSTRDCVDGRKAGSGISELANLRVPGAGEWRLSVWLEDAAGNADRERAATVTGLRFDDEVPNVAFAPLTANDPTVVRANVRETVSGIAVGQIEARRRGEDAWRSLSTRIDDDGFSARLDDEVMPRGVYDLRARVADAAGNERSTQSDTDGAEATRALPLRVRTHMTAGEPRRVHARGARGKRKYRTVLNVSPSARYGRTIPISGRITMPGTNPLAGVDLEVWERVDLPDAEWRRVAVVRTSRSGRFRYKALRGPSRTLRFRYPGTATIRPHSAAVELGVRAVTSFRVTRARVVNGDDVRFHGRLKGRQLGETGKLIHLQVYTRGRWATFATPRANHATGVWSQAYRFTATRGLVRYRFRAVVPREASFPYETGRSSSVRVTVRGL
jgi:hypothetical protein